MVTRHGTSAPPEAGSVRIVLRPMGTALPLGFLSFAIGMLLLGGLEVGWVATREQPTVGAHRRVRVPA